MIMLKREANVYERERLEREQTDREQQARRCCLPALARLSSSPCFFSTACHQCIPPLFIPRCGWRSAWPCDKREGPSEIFNATIPRTSSCQSVSAQRRPEYYLCSDDYAGCVTRAQQLSSAGFDTTAFTRLHMTTQHSSFTQHSIT